MSMERIVAIADRLVKGQSTTIPAMKPAQWDELRWWINYHQEVGRKPSKKMNYMINISPSMADNLETLICSLFTIHRKYFDEFENISIIRFVLKSGDEIKFFFHEVNKFNCVYYRLQASGAWFTFNSIRLGNCISEVEKNSRMIETLN
ncbi:hypothetical protein [Serratia sp. UGAL515B_01]|uniref:hypothetical protein n=1 Tax=Serratia sp. UGAL515B_01 TaxID=2986763 RepID=UPI002953D059|nr:hypothetical protein [Serratia sp. UGAL515B_01]WON75546.1 hypothetical protein OK023_00075 [Serratia sp. UGAL515B_01]